MNKKYISVGLIVVFSLSSALAGVSENIENMVSYAINNNVDYLEAKLDLEQSEENAEVDPIYYDSTVTIENEIETDFTSIDADDFTSTLSFDVPLLEQLSLNAEVDTDLDGSLGFTYSPLVNTTSNVENVKAYENNMVYLSEYKDDLFVSITEAYLNYLLAIENLELQRDEVALDKKLYEEQKSLYQYDEASLVDVQEALVTYTEANNEIRNLEIEVYSTKVSLYELLNVESDTEVEIPITDLDEIFELVEKADSILEGKEFSPLSDYSVVEALNSTIVLEDSYNNLDWYEPSLDITTSVSIDGTLTAAVSFTTGYNDYNGEEKYNLQDEIELAKLTASSTISQVKNDIELLKNTIESDKKSIEDLKLQIEQNALVMEEASALLALDEYEALDYESLQLNEKQLNLNLITAYATLYVDQLNLINYL